MHFGSALLRTYWAASDNAANASRSDQVDIRLFQANLFLEFAIQGLLGSFVAQYAALRELPATPTSAATQEYLPVVADQDDPYVGTEPFGVDEIASMLDLILLATIVP